MKKILFLFISLFLVCSCDKNNEVPDVTMTDKSEIKVENSNILIENLEETITNEGATFTITNNSDQSIYYDYCFSIEKEKNGTWYELKEINNVGCFLYEEEVKSQELGQIKIKIDLLTRKYGNFTKGKYRLIKEVYFKKDDKPNNKFYISAEFEIQ